MTIGDVDDVFVDTNVLVFATIASSPFYRVAAATLQQCFDSRHQLWISRQIIREYLATLTRPQAFTAPVPIERLTEDVRNFTLQFHIAEDGPETTERLLGIMQQIRVGGRQVHDANIVATMQAHGLRRLLTHNVADFTRFRGLIEIVPLVVTS